MFREESIKRGASLTMYLRCDAREGCAVDVELGYLERVFLSPASTGSIDFLVVIRVVDVDFIGVDANDRA